MDADGSNQTPITDNSAADRRYALFSPRDNNQPNLFDQLVMHARKAELPQDEQGLARRLGIAAD